MKKRNVFLSVLLVLTLCFAFAACNEENKVDYGTLTVQNVVLTEGEEQTIVYSFSDPEKAEEISYSYNGSDIEIKDGKVKALKGGAIVAVTAKTAHHEAKFTVTTTAIDYGMLTVANIVLEEGKETKITPVFSVAEKAEDVEYSFSGSDIEIKDGTVKALVGGKTVEVTAKTAHHEAKFTVTTTAIDYGTLTVEDVTGLMTTSGSVRIRATFSIPEKAEEISYSFSGNDIEIEGGKVKALVGGKTVTVTAKTAHHETTFVVTTLIDYGKAEINDVYAWVGYPVSDFDVKFEYPDYAEELTYSYDETKITIDATAKTVKALAAGDVKVTATSENFNTTFTVHAETVDKTTANYNTTNYNSKVAGYKTDWENKGRDKHTTLFIGDSFFDGGFWSNFYKDYAGYDVLRAGVSSTTSCDWEVFTETYLKYTNPKNIVMHMGTNNVYDDGMSINATVSALQRMFYVIHAQLPETHVYYFNISQRTYDDAKIGIVSAVNDIMAQWCANREWITLIDTSSKLTGEMLRDSVHPKNEYYSVFVNALAKTDIVIEDAPVAEGVSFTAGTYDKTAGTYTLSANARTRSYLVDGTSEYSGNFAVSGTAKISALTGNPNWTEFIVSDEPADKWFDASKALPVSNITFCDGGSAIWGYKNGGSNTSLTNVTDGTFTFAVIAYNKSILFAVNDTVKVFEDESFVGTYFGFGAENAKIEVSGLNVIINDDTAVRAKFDGLAPVPSASIDDIIMTKNQAINDGAVTMVYKNETLNRNYVISGKLDITDYANNAHVHFMLSGDGNRILLWDNESKGAYKVGFACNGAYNSDAPAKDIFTKESGKTLTLTWKLVVTASDAYFYVNNELRLVWKSIPGSSLTVSGEHVEGKVYEMSALSLKNDKTEYEAEIAVMQTTIDAYKDKTDGTYRA